LTYIKGVALARRDGAAMAKDAESLIESALRAARARDWAGYRLRFAELRATCAPLAEAHEDLRQQFETLGAAAPQYDPEGYFAALESLAGLLRTRYTGELRAARAQPPAPLDLRGLQPPEPIMRIFEALDRAPGEPLRAILPHEPVPLYALLRERGYSYSGEQRPDGGFELLIERA